MSNNQTKGIAFKNFRRFIDFPMLEFGNITYMVGRNNSGKSTMVKALLLILDYLQNQLSDTFSFDNQALEDANIVTFGRAKCNLIDEPEIVFNLKLNNYIISIHVSGIEGRTKANVNLLQITDDTNGYDLTVNYYTGLTRIRKKTITKSFEINTEEEFIKIDIEINKLKESLKAITKKGSKEGLQIADQINKLEERKEKIAPKQKLKKEEDNIEYSLEYPLRYQTAIVTDLPTIEVDLNINQLVSDIKGMSNYDLLNIQLDTAKKELELAIKKRIQRIVFIHGTGGGVLKSELDYLFKNNNKVTSYEADYSKYGKGATEVVIEITDDDLPRTEDNEFKEVVSKFLYHNTIAYKKIIDERNKSNSEEISDENDVSSDIIELDNSKEDLKDWIDNLVLNIGQESFFYLGANPSKQSALFSLREKGNILAQAIHQFYQLGVQEGDLAWRFVQKWMNEFEVGDDFHIEFYAGEAYEFHTSEDGKVNHLSDKGMGSLQAMTLILRVASLIKLASMNVKKENQKAFTLLVEEPELNLHPELQSKLTDFFHEVNKEYGFNFIIETHSEYMIRRAQLMVLEKDYISNQELNPNPFKIYYFHKTEGPYEMEFNSQGKFNRDFGPGFYNEASKMTMSLIKEIRKNQ